MLKVGLLLLILPPLALMTGYMMEQAEVDACLDAGGAWNYVERVCVDDAASGTFPFVPFMMRHPVLVNGGMLLSVVGLLFCMVGLYRGRT
ncbi:hypothetical protein ADIMK_3320 [Marinobacterium lacunae]|uniref:Uncharacterized protein n=1 Tax=Marinobacterium lacunae TaxID=1232683 RepID=A0A081FV74_9GAMM|nr:hypothetical protein [Marinobacterium lacunae]KEA62429.1 hypothetical protein ADIMK_3320 [Marinobacterium lacunae]MBR9885511.1 hypothetical protein [Oceanospirillales bacterium]